MSSKTLIELSLTLYFVLFIEGILYQEGDDDSTIPLATAMTTLASNVTSTILPTTA